MIRGFGIQRPYQIKYENGALVLISPYNPDLVDAVKRLPSTERKWDKDRKVWLVDPKHADQLASWIDAYAGQKVPLPPFLQAGIAPPVITQVLTLKYLGACKEREDGSRLAYGLVDGEWKAVFPESVLRLWFEGIEPDDGKPSVSAGFSTNYTILGVKAAATVDEIKSAFRRMALQWHPDHCKEPDAAERFIQIKAAYDILSDSNKRARYDMGLALEKKYQAEQRRLERDQQRIQELIGYRAPLRCGILLVEGFLKLGRIEVTKIQGWRDIIDQWGKTLVVSWPAGATEPVEDWV